MDSAITIVSMAFEVVLNIIEELLKSGWPSLIVSVLGE